MEASAEVVGVWGGSSGGGERGAVGRDGGAVVLGNVGFGVGSCPGIVEAVGLWGRTAALWVAVGMVNTWGCGVAVAPWLAVGMGNMWDYGAGQQPHG